MSDGHFCLSILYAQFWGPTDGGEQTQFYTVYDRDGSLSGSKGYLVANNTAILPPNQASCTPKPVWNAYSCPGTCYRAIQVAYPEPGFGFSTNNGGNTRATTRYMLSLLHNKARF